MKYRCYYVHSHTLLLPFYSGANTVKKEEELLGLQLIAGDAGGQQSAWILTEQLYMYSYWTHLMSVIIT